MPTNTSFVCRPSKMNRLGTAPIELCINIDGKRTYIQLNLRCTPADYKTAMTGKGCTPILEYVTACRKRVDDIIIDLTKREIPVTPQTIKQEFSRSSSSYTLGDLFGEWLSMKEKEIGKSLGKDTFRRYQLSAKRFMAANGIDEAYPAKGITRAHLMTFQTELYKVLDKATARNYLMKIKSVFTFAFETGKIPTNPAYGMRIEQGKKDTVLYLTPEELTRIKTHSFGKRLQEIADAFLFSCYTGLSFSDINELSPADFKQERGYTYISKRRKKTGIPFMAVLFEEALAIARKYNYRLPMKSNQKTNAYLKEIGDICEIEKPLHFHIARHTAACYYINHRPALPNETIQMMFGWTNDKQLHHYAKIFKGTVFDDLDAAFRTPHLSRDEREAIENMEWFKQAFN